MEGGGEGAAYQRQSIPVLVAKGRVVETGLLASHHAAGLHGLRAMTASGFAMSESNKVRGGWDG